MRITPHKAEVDAVVAIMESDEYATPEAMAKAIVKAVAEKVATRDNYGVALRMNAESTTVLAVGPFYDKRDAEKFLETGAESGLTGFVAPLSSVESIVKTDDLHLKTCVSCAHRREMHGQMRHGVCAVYKCECKELKLT